jgi:hypothetical protein
MCVALTTWPHGNPRSAITLIRSFSQLDRPLRATVPAGTPTGVVHKLANHIGRVLAGPDLRHWIAKLGGEPMNMTQPEFARFVRSESESAARLILAAGFKPPNSRLCDESPIREKVVRKPLKVRFS